MECFASIKLYKYMYKMKNKIKDNGGREANKQKMNNISK